MAAAVLGKSGSDAEAHFAGHTVLVGPGRLLLQMPQSTRIQSIEGPSLDAGEFVAFVMSGPDRFVFFQTGGYSFNSSVDQTMGAGAYHVYLVTNRVRVELELRLVGLDGFQRFQMEPGEGIVKKLTGADEQAGVPFPGTYPAGVESTHLEIGQRGVVIIVDNGVFWGPSGVSIDIARHSVHGSKGLAESDCRLKAFTFAAILFPGSSVNVSFTYFSIFTVGEGTWKASVEYAGLGAIWLRQHRSFGIAIALSDEDPLLRDAFSFWDMGPFFAPVTDPLPPTVRTLGESVACAEPPGAP